jgi:hypothetical protein
MLSIVFTIACLVAIVVFAIQVYKTATSTGRNAPIWTVVTVFVGFTIQFVLPFFVGLGIGIYYAVTGKPMDLMFGLLTLVDVLGLVLSVVGMSLVMKHVSKVPDDDTSSLGPAPPSPPRFTGE